MSPSHLPEPLLLSEEDLATPRAYSIGGGRAGVYTHRGPHKSSENEDGLLLLPVDDHRAVIAVADGVGGHAAGADAAATALGWIVRTVQAADATEGLRAAIVDGIEQANEAILSREAGSGTTLAVIEIDGNTIRPYHVGDSEIIVTGGGGRLRLRTRSHSPVGNAVAAGIIDEREAMHHEERHIVSNVVGSPEMRIEIGTALQLRPRDTVVLATDGLTDNLYLDEIVELVRKGPLEGILTNLTERADARMEFPRGLDPSKPDDMTFVVYRPGDHGPDATESAHGESRG